MAFQPNVNTYTQGFGSSRLDVQTPHLDIRAPATTDINYPVGKRWIDTVNDTTYTLTSFNASAGVTTAVWTVEGGGSSALASLTGDTGTAIPSGGAIQIAGTASQIVTSATGSVVTAAFATPNFTLSTTLAKLESSAGGTANIITASNLSNTANSSAGFNSLVAGGSAGDPYHFYQIGAGQAWTHGIDNSDSDAFVIAASSALGTSNVMRMSTAGATSFTLGDIDITRSNVGAAVVETISNTDNTNAASNARLTIVTGGASGGDPVIQYTNGVTTWTSGLDNSDGDAHVISASAALGTSNIAFWNTSGAFINTGSITSNSGNLTLTNGNIVLSTAGNKVNITTGANASIGQATLVAGTVTVSTTAVTAGSLIFLSRASIGATGAAATGKLVVGTITAATSFVINSVQAADATALQASDVSIINWWIIN